MVTSANRGRHPGDPGLNRKAKGEIAMQLNGSQIIIECLKEQGVDTVSAIPEAPSSMSTMNYTDTRRSGTSSPPRAGRVPCGGRLCQSYGKSGRVLCHQRPRRNQSGHRYCHRLYGFIPVVAITANVGTSPPGQGQLPGGGYRRHHHAGDQIQRHRQGCECFGKNHPQGL